MKFTILTTLVVLFIFNSAFGQNDKYDAYVEEATKLYDSKEYKKSADKYKEAFDQLEGKAYPYDRYRAACSYALAKDKDQAFYHLFRLAENPNTKYSEVNQLTADADLKNLHKDKRWTKLIEIVKTNKQENEKEFDHALVAMLDTIHTEDQTYRKQLDEIEAKFGRDSKEIKAHWELINEKDSINLIKVKKILDERGWLGPKIVGYQGNGTLFLVIQHADIETQLKYLPMMREAVKVGDANAGNLALLEDRVSLRQGKRQIYGSQIGRDPETGAYYVQPLIDPENVDERRAEVGLGPISEYVNYWGMTWDLEEHVIRTEKIEASQGK